ncbi:hypothetical protein B0A48_02977 [Cryoendolithus antarcticus]|uniref:Uncharacterized protein n=1 Tax=Cryoendolithus antarcticus TaxID=1507870 RepID=A0A1V8TLT1_9PEZI|nr:hypothetical protein B0A48_02977 [Cryoendolithus antarcticus]
MPSSSSRWSQSPPGASPRSSAITEIDNAEQSRHVQYPDSRQTRQANPILSQTDSYGHGARPLANSGRQDFGPTNMEQYYGGMRQALSSEADNDTDCLLADVRSPVYQNVRAVQAAFYGPQARRDASTDYYRGSDRSLQLALTPGPRPSQTPSSSHRAPTYTIGTDARRPVAARPRRMIADVPRTASPARSYNTQPPAPARPINTTRPSQASYTVDTAVPPYDYTQQRPRSHRTTEER